MTKNKKKTQGEKQNPKKQEIADLNTEIDNCKDIGDIKAILKKVLIQ